MKVIGTKVLVQVDNTACTQKIGNFTIPMDEVELATIVSVGNEVNKDGEILSPGDKLYIYPKSGKDFVKDGEKFKVITLNEIIVVL